MNEIMKRMTAESPSFFKRIQTIGITLGAIGVAIMAIPASVIALPAFVGTMAGYFIAIGTVAAAIAKTTVKDASILDSKNETPK